MTEDLERAIVQWQIVVQTFPLQSEVLFMVYFKHREHPFKFFHRHFKTLREAQTEEKRLTRDLEELRDEKFREKYRIGHDLKGSLL